MNATKVVGFKAFTENFYRKIAFAELGPVLDTLEYVRHHTTTWLEITTLLIPGHNDGDDELQQLSRWVHDHLGPDVPLHFSAFHPDFKMIDIPATPPATLTRARQIARDAGVDMLQGYLIGRPRGELSEGRLPLAANA